MKRRDDRLAELKLKYPAALSATPPGTRLRFGAGWDHLVEVLFTRLEFLLRDEAKQSVRIAQVRSKGGCLCVSYSLSGQEGAALSAQLRAAIRLAREASGYICEGCGTALEIRDGICDRCRSK